MTAETTLVGRLRSIARGDPNTDEWSRVPDIHWEAVDEIERLTADLAAMTAERDKYRSQAIALFWAGNADNVTADKIREAAATIDAALAAQEGT